MSRKHSFDNNRLNEEFDNVYDSFVRMFIGTQAPIEPKKRTMWFNPDTNKLKIWNGREFISLN